VQKNHWLLRLLKLRLIVNGMHIYPLQRNTPVRVVVSTNPSKIVVSDGFHITKPMQVTYADQRTYYYNIGCAIDNDLLVGGMIFMLMLFSMGATSGFLLLEFLSLSPVIYILVLYYIKRKDFIQIQPASAIVKRQS
jgi:hypothetical protein